MSNDEKLFYGIGEVAEIVQVKPYVLRYWETEFKKLNPQKSFTGQRTYKVKDIQVALTIKKLLYDDKYTIAGAVQRLVELEAQGQFVPFGGETPPSVSTTTETKPESATVLPAAQEVPEATTSVADKMKLDEKKVHDLKTLLEATKKVLKKYNLS